MTRRLASSVSAFREHFRDWLDTLAYKYTFTYYSNNNLINYIDERMAVALIRDYVKTCTKAINDESSAEASLLSKISELLNNQKS